MGWRFRKSVRLGKGVRLNFSKSGVSTTFGGRGMSVSVSKRGVYRTTSIPGTGLSNRKKICGSSHRSRTASSPTTKTPAAIRQWREYTGLAEPEAQARVTELGEIVFLDGEGQIIEDKKLISIIRRTPQFQEERPRLEQAQREAVERALLEERELLDTLTEPHRHAPALRDISSFEQELEELTLERYEPEVFAEQAPTVAQVQEELSREADREVKTLAFWKARNLKDTYVRERIHDRVAAQTAEWMERKKAFEREQQATADELNAGYEAQFAQQRDALTRAIAGDAAYIEQTAAEWMAAWEFPLDMGASFAYDSERNALAVDFDLPDVEDFPNTTVVPLKTGGARRKAKTQKQVREEYARCVFSLLVYAAANLFNLSPRIEHVVLSAFTQRCDKTGRLDDVYIASIDFDRADFAIAIDRHDEARELCDSFEHRYNLTSTNIFKAIEPFE